MTNSNLSFITHHIYIILTKLEIGLMPPSAFDGMDSDDMTVEQIVHGPFE